ADGSDSAGGAGGEGEVKAGPTVDVSGVLQMMLSLALVVALIVALSWVVGRLRRVQRSSPGPLAILGELVVGPKERVLLVRVGEGQALVGVGGAGVTSLSLLDKPVQAENAAVDAGTFAQRLREIMNRSGIGK